MRWVGLWLVVTVLAAGTVASAASTLTFVAADSRRVACDGTVVLTLPGGAEAVASRLNALAEAGAKASEFTIRKEGRRGRDRVIVARGTRVVSLPRSTARAMGTSAGTLAQQYLARLQKQFRRPYLSAAPSVVPLGETRSVRVYGNIVGAVRVGTDSSVATGAWNAATKSVSIVGRERGRATLTVRDTKNEIRIPVRVAKYAVQMDGPVTATVTGSPASRFAAESAVAAAVQSAVRAEPGASCEIVTGAADVSSLYPGHTIQVPVSISGDGPDYLPYRARPIVTVANRSVPLAPVTTLMVSNSPEKLASHGLWYEGVLSDEQSARLLYHHVNTTEGRALLVVELWNRAAEPAQVHVTAGLGGPSYDELWVGHRAASEYLRSASRGAGWIVSLPPGTVMTAFSQSMPRGSVASGVAELRTLGAASVSVRVYLLHPDSAIGLRPVEDYQPSPLLGQWQYPQPLRQVTARYEVGGNWAFVTIGDQPAVGVKEGDRLLGGYGVMYEVKLELANPQAVPADVVVLMEPAGGVARGCFLLDGRAAETGVLRNSDEGPIATYHLAAGQTRTVTILTMPQSGSNYPVRLVARVL